MQYDMVIFFAYFSIAFILNKLQVYVILHITNSPFLSTASAISLIFLYSITLGFPFFLQKTPTFSSGFALTTILPAANTFYLLQPNNTSSTIFTKTLSTPPINTHSTPNFSFYLSFHFLLIASKIPSMSICCSFINSFFIQ